jgi:hypothetical protein
MVARTVSRALSVLSAWNRRAKERIAQDLYARTDVIDYLGAIVECEDSCSPALPIVGAVARRVRSGHNWQSLIGTLQRQVGVATDTFNR